MSFRASLRRNRKRPPKRKRKSQSFRKIFASALRNQTAPKRNWKSNPPTVRVWWHAVPFVHRDRTPLDLVSDLLTGRTGRLYKTLVLGRQIANQVEASVDLRKYAGAFEVECVVKEDKDPSDVEAAIHEEIRRLRDEPVPAEEMQKVKNQGKASAYRRLSSPFSIAIQLLYYDGLGDWKYINSYADEVDAVTAADIQRVARTYFTKENRTVGVFLRKEAEASPAPPAAPGEGAR